MRRIRSKLKKKWYQDQLSVFLIGVLIGVALAIWTYHNHDSGSNYQLSIVQYLTAGSSGSGVKGLVLSYAGAIYNFDYERWLRSVFGGVSVLQVADTFRYTTNGTKVKRSNSSGLILESEAHFLYNQIPIVCVILNPDSSDAITAVVSTWARTCNDIRFYYSPAGRVTLKEKTVSLNESLVVNQQLIAKVKVIPDMEATSEFGMLCRAFRHIWKHKRKMASKTNPWILVAPYNSYVLTENLRFFVAPLNMSVPHYLGHAMKFWGSVYNWAEAGYAINWETVHRLVEKFRSDESCDAGGKFWKNGDWYLGKHLSSMGIKPLDTRDHIGRGRFNGYSMKRLLFPGGVSSFERYWRDSLYGASPDGPGCCSNFAITFAGVLSHSKMYQQDYLNHRLKPFHGGGDRGNKQTKNKLRSKNPSMTLSEALKEEALGRIFDPTLTTPKSLGNLFKQLSNIKPQ